MVRKWSYLTPVRTTYLELKRPYTIARYTFKVFRVTTRFKKYSLGLTKFMRKAFAKRKHKTNWLTLSYALYRWVFFYLRNKQFIRYFQAIGMFSYSLVSTSTNFFLKQSELFPLVSGLAILSCSKNILQSFLLNHVNYFTSPLPNNPSTFLLSRDLNELNTCNEINPGLLFYDNLMYPYNLRPLWKQNSSFIKNLTIMSYKTTLKFILYIYKILIKLILNTTYYR